MSEPRYTLAEAKRRLAEIECAEHGHDLGEIRRADGTTVSVYCGRCEVTFEPSVLTPLPPAGELRQDVFRSDGGRSLRLTHVGTGMVAVAEGEDSVAAMRHQAERLLRARLLVAQLEREAK
jgi:hypothetical protein